MISWVFEHWVMLTSIPKAVPRKQKVFVDELGASNERNPLYLENFTLSNHLFHLRSPNSQELFPILYNASF